MGFLNNISSDDMILVSISFTSPLIRAMMSPFRSSEKNPNGSANIFLYSWIRISRTTPVRIGIIMAEEKK